MMKKKCYEKPILSVEWFSTNSYIAGCYNYTGVLECDYGWNGRNATQESRQKPDYWYQNDSNYQGYVKVGSYIAPDGHEHGSPCSYIEVEADGVNITGKEYGKSYISIYNVNVGSFNWNTAENGTVVNGVTWESKDGITYEHYGKLTFSSRAEQIEGRPNHS